MKLLDRYADYALIGTLFLLLGFLIEIFTGISTGSECEAPSLNLLLLFLNNSDAIRGIDDSYKISLLSTLAVATVFAIGFLIDTISPVLVLLFETLYFRYIAIKESKEVIDSLFESCASSSQKLAYLKFNRPHWLNWLAARTQYSVIFPLILAHCIDISSQAIQEDLMGKIQSWRISRSLGGAIFLASFLVGRQDLSIPSLLTIAAALILAGLVTVGNFSRLCHAMAAILSLTKNRKSSDQ